jgi:hypothetical protein
MLNLGKEPGALAVRNVSSPIKRDVKEKILPLPSEGS